MASSTVLVPGDITFRVPALGDGFDLVDDDFSDQLRPSALTSFETNSRDGDGTVISSVTEVKESYTDSDELNLTGEWKDRISANFGFTSYRQLTQENSLFMFTATVVKKTDEIKPLTPVLSKKLIDLANESDGQFRKSYGYYYVDGVDRGGSVLFLYRFKTRDTTTRTNIEASISQASYGSAKLTDVLSSRGINTEWTAQTIIAGGVGPISLSPEFNASLTALNSWVGTIGAGRVVRFRLTPYQDTFPIEDQSGDITLGVPLTKDERDILRSVLKGSAGLHISTKFSPAATKVLGRLSKKLLTIDSLKKGIRQRL